MIHRAAAGLRAVVLVLSVQAGAAAHERQGPLVIAGTALEPEPAETAVATPDGSWQIVPRAALFSAASGPEASRAGAPVLYVAGRPRTDFSRRIVTGEIAVELAPGAEPADLAAGCGLTDLGPVRDLDGFHLFRADPPAAALDACPLLVRDPRVRTAEPLLARRRAPRGVPNDPLFSSQWHLGNTAPGGYDLNVQPVWGTFGGAGRRGQGVRLGIIDDGIDYTHADLIGRIDQTSDINFNSGDPASGAAQSAGDRHGTAVAGLAAATANNALGVAGVAPEARLVSLRLTAGTYTDDHERQAFLHLQNNTLSPPNLIHVKNSSWGPEDGFFDLDGPGALARAALTTATTNGRGGKGTVFVWAVGNGGAVDENANFDGYANDPHVIAVGAVGSDGGAASYSEAGACVAVVAFGDDATQSVVTTDRPGTAGFNPPAAGGAQDLADPAYTRRFGGTSAAAPQVAGVAALMLQANPNLGWRDVKELLMRSARQVDAASPGWFTNSAGFHFHDRYGAGLVDASAAVALAESPSFVPLGTLRTIDVENTAAAPVPDDSPAGLVRTFTFTGQRRRVEHVALTLTLPHSYPGDLRLRLTSPAGTVSELARPFYDPFTHTGFNAWTFTSVQFWGEESPGTWTLRITDEADDDTGTYQRATLRLYGTDAPNTPVFTSPAVVKCGLGTSVNHTFTATNGPVSWSSQGPLPPGTALHPTTGVLSGNCGQRGRFSAQIRATNSSGTTVQLFSLVVQSHYEQWADGEGLTEENAGPGADPDGDGSANVLEYAAGSPPLVRNRPFAPTVGQDATGRPVVSFRRWPARDDANWVLEQSADLVTWSPAAFSDHGQSLAPLEPRFATAETPNGDGTVTATCTDLQPAARTWFRLRAVAAP